MAHCDRLGRLVGSVGVPVRSTLSFVLFLVVVARDLQLKRKLASSLPSEK